MLKMYEENIVLITAFYMRIETYFRVYRIRIDMSKMYEENIVLTTPFYMRIETYFRV